MECTSNNITMMTPDFKQCIQQSEVQGNVHIGSTDKNNYYSDLISSSSPAMVCSSFHKSTMLPTMPTFKK